MTDLCEETFALDMGYLKCDFIAGHAGPHKDIGPNDAVWWQKERITVYKDGQDFLERALPNE